MTELDTYSGLGFAYLVTEATVFKTTKKLEQEYCAHLALLVTFPQIKALTPLPTRGNNGQRNITVNGPAYIPYHPQRS